MPPVFLPAVAIMTGSVVFGTGVVGLAVVGGCVGLIPSNVMKQKMVR